MDKIVVFREVQIPLPVIGIPLTNYFNTYIAALSNLRCIISARLIVKKHCDRSFDEDDEMCKSGDVEEHILKRFNTILWSVERKCIEGDVEVHCDNELPLLTVLSVLDCELSKKILMMDTSNYVHVFNALANLDAKLLNIDPGYLRALRCSYLFRAPCVSRGYEDVVHNVALVLNVERINKYDCNQKLCVHITNPYDSYSLSLFYKLVTHVISQLLENIIQGRGLDQNVKNMIRLVHVIESEIVRDSLGIKVDYPMNDEMNLYKSVVDLNQVVLYRMRLP